MGNFLTENNLRSPVSWVRTCSVCTDPIGDDFTICCSCMTWHHSVCWAWEAGCAGEQYLPAPAPPEQTLRNGASTDQGVALAILREVDRAVLIKSSLETLRTTRLNLCSWVPPVATILFLYLALVVVRIINWKMEFFLALTISVPLFSTLLRLLDFEIGTRREQLAWAIERLDRQLERTRGWLDPL